MSAIELSPGLWTDTFTAIAILGGAVVFALIVLVAAGVFVRRRAGGTRRELGERLVRVLRGPISALVIVQAVGFVVATLPVLRDERPVVERAWFALTILIVVYGVQRLIVPLTQWYAERTTTGRSRIHSLPPLQRGLKVVLWVAGGLVVLDAFGIQISPLLAGLGLGGLAVALALQPLLANVFASSYLLSDQSIRIGDAIQVQGGPSGVIEDIGWRATRLRSPDHNLVLVPNSVLAQATMTNFDADAPETDVTLTLRVAATEDLSAVETACVEELMRLCEEAEGLVAAGVPVSFRYQGFVDGKAEVLLRVRAASWREVSDLRHRMIIRIHARLQSENVALV